MVAAVRYLRRVRPDVVVFPYNPFMYGCRGVVFSCGLWPAALRLLGGVPTVAVLHELYRPSRPHDRRRDALRSLTQRLQFRWCVRGADALVVTTANRARQVAAVAGGVARIRRIPVGTNILPDRPHDPSEPKRRAGVGSSTPLRLVTFGFLGPERLWDVLFDSLAEAEKALSRPLRLTVLGAIDRTHKDFVKVERRLTALRLDSVVEWTGYLPPAEVPCRIDAADAYIALYKEGISGRRTTAMAALAHGVPIIASMGAETDVDWFAAGENTLLIPPTAEALGAAIVQLDAEPHLRAHLARCAQASYERTFCWSRIARSYDDIMRAVIRRHKLGHSYKQGRRR